MNEKKAYSVDISVSGSITVMAASEEDAQQLVDNGLAGEDSALLQEIISMLKDHIDIGVDGLKDGIMRSLCDGEYALNAGDVAEIEELERNEYLSQAFIQGKDPMHTIVRRRRIDGVGCIEVSVEAKGGVIKSVGLTGDFFATGDVDAMLHGLEGVGTDCESISAALPERVDNIIMNLRKDDLVNLLADS